MNSQDGQKDAGNVGLVAITRCGREGELIGGNGVMGLLTSPFPTGSVGLWRSLCLMQGCGGGGTSTGCMRVMELSGWGGCRKRIVRARASAMPQWLPGRE